MPVKQVIIVRTRFPDGKGGHFGMRTGKLAAQVAHASMKVFFDRGDVGYSWRTGNTGTLVEPDDDPKNLGERVLLVPLTAEMQEWVEGIFTKVVVGVETEEDLLRCHELAKERGLPAALIQDMGATEFKAPCSRCKGTGKIPNEGESYATHGVWAGLPSPCTDCDGSGKVPVPTHTTVAIGPDEAARIDEITGPSGLVKVKLL